ncbi:MAG: NAD(+) synthase, partial [Muribaculaceae bacterium]|nr:NAD(+) synthase [Muribaculaceae bacterium]
MNKYGYIRVAAGVPKVNVADCEANTKGIIELAEIAYGKKADVMVFPELAVTAYTCGDLFTLSTLIQAAEAAVERIRVESYNWHDMLVVVGAPLKESDKLYNCAVAIQNGEIVGVVPKTHLPNYGEFYEMRWFCPAKIEESKKEISIAGYSAPFGANLLFHKGSAKIGIEICEDLWTPIPPSSYLAQCGANLILNLSASDEVAGKHDYLLNLISQQSARCRVGYVYSSCGFGESTTDMVFGGNALICESGVFLAKSHDLFAINQLS